MQELKHGPRFFYGVILVLDLSVLDPILCPIGAGSSRLLPETILLEPVDVTCALLQEGKKLDAPNSKELANTKVQNNQSCNPKRCKTQTQNAQKRQHAKKYLG